MDSIRLRTLTRLWLFGRYLYSVGRTPLPSPISHRAIGYSLVVVGPWWVVLHLLGVPFTGAGMTFHFLFPALLVWWLLHVVAEGARPSEAVSSWVRLLWHVTHTRAVVPVRVRERGAVTAKQAAYMGCWVLLGMLTWGLSWWRTLALLAAIFLLVGVCVNVHDEQYHPGAHKKEVKP